MKTKEFSFNRLLGIFVLALVFVSGSIFAIKAAQASSEDSEYELGSLVKVKNMKGAAVYQIGSDGKKYIFPDEKTFKTWYDDFSEVEEVSQEALDNYSDGGMVTIRPGTRLLTHRNTARVYVVARNGELIYIPDEATARKFYGDNWNTFVIDIDPGFFAANYQVSDEELSENNLPEDNLVMEKETGNYFLIENGLRRRVHTENFVKNRLNEKKVIILDSLSDDYDDGEELELEEEDVYVFNPGAGAEKVLICHRPLVATAGQGRTIRVSEQALAAHLAHGDIRGACPSDDDDDDVDDDNNLPDLKIDDITLSLENPTVNSTTTLTMYVKNSGEVTLTDTTGVLNMWRSFEDFETTALPGTIPSISESNPFEPGDRVAITWVGHFNSSGEKQLQAIVDNGNELDEEDETNNYYSEEITVSQ